MIREDEQAAEPVVIKATGLTMHFGGVVAVSGVDLEVRRGEVVGIMGPNGAGKSTLLSMLCGARKPTAGELAVRGRDMAKVMRADAPRIGIGLAHQIPKPFRSLTVRQNLEVAAQVTPRSRRADLVRDSLNLSGMAGKANILAANLGLLDLKRLELARVLALDPEVILLDEVAAGLTGKDLDDLISLIAAIRDSGRTIVIVEHVQDVLHQLAQRVVVLEWGQKLLEGTPKEVSEDQRVIDIYLGTGEQVAPREPRILEPGETPLLELKSVAAGYGAIQVLPELSFSVAAGEVLAVLGANGAGKSTLARAVQGAIPVRAGSIVWDGVDVTRFGAARRLRAGCALVPEGRRLFASLTVRENLELGLRSSRNTTPLDRVYELFPRLTELADRRAGGLSGGEQQMVAIGRAMASDPRLHL